MEIFKLFGSILVNNDEANKSISKTDEKAEGLGKRLIGGIGTAVKWGGALAAAAGSAAIGLGTVATKAAMDFEAQMSNVATLLDGDVNKRIEELGDTVKKLSLDTGTSTDLLTDGLYQVISAFGDTADSMGILETASKGAKAGNATVTDSVNLLAAVTKGYGDTSAEAAQKASDLAFLTVKLGQTSFPELASSMGKVIPLASTMKVSQEELFGAMATLTGVTGNTAEVSTQLRATIQGMLQPTTAMSGKIKELGYENGQAMIESLGLQGTLDKLKESVGGNEIAFSELFGSVEAKNAVLALTGAQAENFTEKTNAMKEAVGATDEAFKRQTDNVKSNFAKLKNTFDVMMISLGERFLPVLNNILKWVDSKMPIIQTILESVFDAIGVAVEGISFVISSVFNGMNTDFSGLFNTIKSLWETYGVPTFEAFSSVFQTVYDNAQPIIEGIQILFETLMSYMSTYWESFGKPVWEFFVEAIQKVAEVFNYVWPIVVDIFSGLCDTLNNLWESILKPIFEAIGWILENVLLPIFKFVFEDIANRVKIAFDNISTLWNTVLKPILDGIINFIGGIFSGNWSQIWTGITQILSGIWGAIKMILWSPIEWAINKIGGIVEWITSPFKKAADAIGNIWSSIKSVFKLPHFTFSGSMNPLNWLSEGLPKIGVEWYYNGGIFTQPTILPGGIGVGDKFNGKGSNAEAVVPLDAMYENIREIVSTEQDSHPIYVIVNVENNMDNKAIGKAITTEVEKNIKRGTNNYMKGKGGVVVG
ncbi:phage tail tape measure protein [Clostridium sp. DSM 100503]|uniref:phage tail tape measure protein n=1 Tax=Clostridium sp. DSM 100503 TaxID=2963282 RepID=UPI00214A2001|nr:phage tail tape measure protein [Clostridium sp. DSM 100503]MCR1953006.1 phage tail tape measure protein [Clostridium sp. DSM 100503]